MSKEYALDRIQAQLRPDAAMLTWVDLPGAPQAADPNGEHWACVVRQQGLPLWTKLPGSGPGGSWQPADDELPSQAHRAFSSLASDSEGRWSELARKLYAQRLAPVEKRLGAEAGLPAVRHLIVLSSSHMAAIPVEVLTDRYTISYAPSGTLFAWLQEKGSQERRSGPASMLAVGDPVFEAPQPSASPPPPEQGVIIAAVVPGSNAAGSGIKRGVVLDRVRNVDVAPTVAALLGVKMPADIQGHAIAEILR